MPDKFKPDTFKPAPDQKPQSDGWYIYFDEGWGIYYPIKKGWTIQAAFDRLSHVKKLNSLRADREKRLESIKEIDRQIKDTSELITRLEREQDGRK